MKKIFLTIFLAVTLIFIGSQEIYAESTGRVFDAVVVNNIDFLALRKGPATSYEEWARIPPGSRIEVIYGGSDLSTIFSPYDPNFVCVRYNGIYGFSHIQYIRQLGNPPRSVR